VYNFSYIMKHLRYLLATLVCLMGAGTFHEVLAIDQVGKYQVYEIELIADTAVADPFDTYLLKVELKSPTGRRFVIDGFFDGDGAGGQDGRVWKVRICPDEAGMWRWQTVPSDKADAGLLGKQGRFECIDSDDPGGLVGDGKYFRFQEGGYTFLQGNFLDFSEGLSSTHVYMSEMLTDGDRAAILARQRDFHKANKINVYFANKGDYGGVATSPWVTVASGHDRSRMDLARWKQFDQYLQDFKRAGMFAEMWFFADDSGFGGIPQADKNRLFRYAMARTSAYSHTLYVIALEWQEGWSLKSVRNSGDFIQQRNPWDRLLSVHSLPSSKPDSFRSFLAWIYTRVSSSLIYSEEPWADFVASQAGNSATPQDVNALALEIGRVEQLPHISEEFGILRENQDLRLMRNMWANFLGGAAGGGTGSDAKRFMEFLAESMIPFQKMRPMNQLVVNGRGRAFCLAEPGHHYLIYSMAGEFRLEIAGKNLSGSWLNPADPDAGTQKAFSVLPGVSLFQPPEPSGDWVLWLTDGTGLRYGSLYPTEEAAVVKASGAVRGN
jgi:hypothetical protein